MEHPENNEAYKGLTVNKGIEQPSVVNPYLKLRKKPQRRQYTAAEYVEGIVKGDITVLSQAVTLVESLKPEHQVLAQEVIEKCLPYSGNSVRIGISGVPGAGKSTSIDVFGLHVLQQYGGKLAVLAIDPSSERSKGSILGDKTRMEKLSVLQGIKRGIMEMADGIIINKADGSNVEKAKLAATHFRNALRLFPPAESGWTPEVLTYSGFYGLGIQEIWDMVYRYFDFVRANGYFQYRRNEQAKYWMYETINEHLRDSFYQNPTIAAELPLREQEVLGGLATSFTAAKKLLDAYFNELKNKA